MKYRHIIILICMTLIGSITIAAQTPTGTDIYLVYIDNSKVSNSEQLLSDQAFQSMEAGFDSIINIKKAPFILYLSNHKDYSMTDNPNSVDKVITNAQSTNPHSLPDQLFDISKIRVELFDKIQKYNGNVHVIFYLSEELASNLLDKYSPLVTFFPSEISFMSGKTVDVTVNFNNSDNRIKMASLDKSLTFYFGEGGLSPSLSYTYVPF